MAEYHIQIGDITVEVVKKRMKNMRLRVSPPDGRVRVSAPHRVSRDEISDFVVDKADWIRRKQRLVRNRHPSVPNEVVTGETHPVQGIPHQLQVVGVNGPRRVEVGPDQSIQVYVRPGDPVETRRRVLQGFYRRLLQDQVPQLIARWEPIIGVDVAECRIRRMKTRWGSCNIRARRIWLNLELARRSPACLEFVLVHEMVHLHERYHNKRFYDYMDRFIPEWRKHQKELKRQAPVD